MTQIDHSKWKGHPGCEGCPFAGGAIMQAQGVIWMDEKEVVLREVVWLPRIWRGCPAWPHLIPEPHTIRHKGWEQVGKISVTHSHVARGIPFDYGVVEYEGVGRPTRKTKDAEVAR